MTSAEMQRLAQGIVTTVRAFVAQSFASRDERIAALEARVRELEERERGERLRIAK